MLSPCDKSTAELITLHTQTHFSFGLFLSEDIVWLSRPLRLTDNKNSSSTEVAYKYFNVLFCHKYNINIRKKHQSQEKTRVTVVLCKQHSNLDFHKVFLTPLNKQKNLKLFKNFWHFSSRAIWNLVQLNKKISWTPSTGYLETEVKTRESIWIPYFPFWSKRSNVSPKRQYKTLWVHV